MTAAPWDPYFMDNPHIYMYMLVLHETLLASVLMYGSETILWKEKERSRIRAVQMDNLRGLLRIRRMGGVKNVWIRGF